jgi:hypothetical protein
MQQSGRAAENQLADLYLLGTGIDGVRQMTAETRDVLRRCRIVLHLSDQHRALSRLNPNTVNLDEQYWTGELREAVYRRLVRMVMEEVERGPGVALVSYGHPLLFDDSAATLRRKARRRGWRCAVLPAISCLDTLCIDLAIDYGDGLQVFDAYHLVESKLTLCPMIHTLIFQLYEFGWDRTADAIQAEPGRFHALERHLSRFYPKSHPVFFIYSDDGDSGLVRIKTRIDRIDTRQSKMFPGLTLYLPPMTR